MQTDIILKVIGIALTVAIGCFVLQRLGRDDQATVVSLVGTLTLLIIVISQISELFDTVRTVFGF